MAEPTERDRKIAESYVGAWFIDAPKTREDLLRLFLEAIVMAREEGRQEERERCAVIARSFGSPDDLVTLGPYEWHGDLCAAAIVDAIIREDE